MAVLSLPDPAWLRSPADPGRLFWCRGCLCRLWRRPAVRQSALTYLREKGRHGPWLPLPLSAGGHPGASGTAGDRGGPAPRERGDRLHQVLARLLKAFNQILKEHGWDHVRARKVLEATARQVLGDLLQDPHWQAELERWLGAEEGGRGLLREWLPWSGSATSRAGAGGSRKRVSAGSGRRAGLLP